jgi:hypothetical protein
VSSNSLTIEESGMRKTKWNRENTRRRLNLRWEFGILAALLAAAGCFNPIAPPSKPPVKAEAAEAASGSRPYEPYTVNVYLNGDGPPAGRSVAGPTKERISGPNIRNYVQVIAIDMATGEITGFTESRRTGLSQAAASLTLKGLVAGHTYGILYLEGHWERDYAAETADGDYAYTGNPPTLLGAGYKDLPFSGGDSVTITVWPIYVDTVFTAAGLTVEPVVNAGKPGVVNLVPAAWTVNWKILRGESGSSSGLGDLITAQRAAGSEEYGIIPKSLKAVLREDGYGETSPIPALTGHTVTLPLRDYTNISRTGGGSVNFALQFVPFNLTEGWDRHDAISVFDLAAGPPVWVIRNGLNDFPQDQLTDFEKFGNVPISEANGNGAVRFMSADPPPAAEGKLVVWGGTYKAPFINFTTSGYDGTAQVWYAIGPANAAAPAYSAFTLLGNIACKTHTIHVTIPEGSEYDVWLVLFKDGKAGAPHRIALSGILAFDPTKGSGEPPPEPFTNVAFARDYLTGLTRSGSSLGSAAANPVLLPMRMNLSGDNSLENLIAAVAETGKYADLDLSLCSINALTFTTDPSKKTGKDRVISLILPNTARNIPDDPGAGGNPAFKHFTSLKTISGRGITSVGKAGFKGCTALTSVDLPAATTVASDAFRDSTSLTSVNLPALTTVASDAFRDNTSLTAVNLPAAKDIGDRAFQNCASLASVNLPAAKGIGAYAFQNCTSLTAVNLPAVTSIGENIFMGTGTEPLTVTLPQNAPASGGGSQAPVAYDKIVTINLPGYSRTYDVVWQETFRRSFGTNAEITLIGNSSFFSLPITDVEAARRYMALDPRGGINDPVPLPVKIELGNKAVNLRNFLSRIAELNLGKYIDLDLSRCPIGGGTEFFPEPGNGAGRNLVVSLVLPDAARHIPGADSRFKYFSNLKAVSGSGVRSIGTYAFRPMPGQFSLTRLATVDFPEVTRVEAYAFQYCSGLTTVNLPKLTTIGGYAFSRCTSPFTLNAPNLTTIGIFPEVVGNTNWTWTDTPVGVFEFSGLKEANFPKATRMGEAAFRDCRYLTKVDMPNLTAIPNSAFLRSGITEAVFLSVTSIGEYAFLECKSLRWAVLPNLTNIANSAFFDCAALTDIDMRQVIDISSNAFWGCTSLKRAEFPHIDNGGLGDYVFARCTSLEYVDLSFYEPNDLRDGVFWETGSTPITIWLNPLEGGEGRPWFPDYPNSATYSKTIHIRHADDGARTGSRYDDPPAERDLIYSWFGKNCKYTITYPTEYYK